VKINQDMNLNHHPDWRNAKLKKLQTLGMYCKKLKVTLKL